MTTAETVYTWILKYSSEDGRLSWENDEQSVWLVAMAEEAEKLYYYNLFTAERTWESPTGVVERKRLVVLDLSLFVEREKYVPGKQRKRTVRGFDNGECFRNLISRLNDLGWDCATWTCPVEENAQSDLAMLCPVEGSLVFSWTQREADRTDRKMASGKPIMLKRVTKIADAFPEYNLEDILILDDEPEKLAENPLGNGLVLNWEDMRNSEFLVLMSELAKVQSISHSFSNIRDHPFACRLQSNPQTENTEQAKPRYDGILGKPARRNNLTPSGTTWNKQTARNWFDYISQSQDEREAKSRLALMAETFPSHKDYCENNLRRTMNLWTEYTTVWKRKYGMKFSNIAEGWFNTLKSQLGNNKVELTGLVDFIYECAQRRQSNYCFRRSIKIEEKLMDISSKSLEQLQESLNTKGFKPVINVLRKLEEEEHQIFILSLIQQSEDWQNCTLVDAITRDVLVAVESNRSSGSRFLYLLNGKFPLAPGIQLQNWKKVITESSSHSKRGWLLIMSSRTGGKKAVVYLSEEGGLACACSIMPEYGAWCPHIWNAFSSGFVGFSPLHHLDDEVALKQPLLEEERFLWIENSRRQPLVPLQAINVGIDWAYERTKNWSNKYQLQGLRTLHTDFGTAEEETQDLKTVESERDRLKKMAFHLINIVLVDEQKKSKFVQFYNEIVSDGPGASSAKKSKLMNPAPLKTGAKRRDRSTDVC